MSDYLEIEPGLIVSDDGEIIESAHQNDTLAFVARRRHEAHVQEKDWHDFKRVLDAVLMRQQSEKRTAYGDTVVTVQGGTYQTFDRVGFAAFLSQIELTRDELLALAGAATGFAREDMPDATHDIYDESVTTKEKRPWVLSSVARRPAPHPKVVGGSELEDMPRGVGGSAGGLEASVATLGASR